VPEVDLAGGRIVVVPPKFSDDADEEDELGEGEAAP
jgi:hypothetical protein